MRRLVAALLVASLALTLSGCGGGGGEDQAAAPADGTTGQAAAPAPAPAPAGAATSVIADRSDLSGEVFVPFPNGEGVPSAVKERLDADQAMILIFYNSAQDVTNDLRAQVNKVAEDNTGLVDLLSYDVGKYADVDSRGNVTVNEEKLSADPNGQEAVTFAHAVGVDHLPYLIVVDEQGYEIFWSRGYIDAQLLDRQVQRAAQ